MSNTGGSADSTVLEIRNLAAGYGKSEVLHGISLKIAAGEIVTLVGANGAGKTTTLRSIFGLTHIRSGEIRFKGQNITGEPAHSLVRLGLALIPQERNVFPSLSVYENLEMGGYSVGRAQLLESIERSFERFPRLKERRQQKAGTLSGGERQMLAICRGLMTDPQLLMLDEPSLGLAPKLVEAVFEQVELIQRGGTTVFLVEQNARRALSIANRAYILELGQIRYQGSGPELLGDPQVQRAYLGTE
jgi:branched-chain amino acid transport system ATP-binding protein